MTKQRADHLTRFEGKGVGTKSGQKPISVMLPIEADAIVRSMSNRSEWVRQAILEKLQREGKLLNSETEPEPTPDRPSPRPSITWSRMPGQK